MSEFTASAAPLFVDGAKDHLELLLSFGEVGIWELDTETGHAVRNLRHDQIFGYETACAEWTFDIFLNHVVPEERTHVRNRFTAAVEAGEKWSFDAKITRADGTVGFINASGQPIKDTQGEAVKLIGHVIDVTQIKRDALRMEVLAGELNHRVNNTLAMVRAMINLSARNAGSAEDLSKVLQTRIAALARTNQLLTGRAGGTTRLADMIEAEIAPFAELRDRVRISGDTQVNLPAKVIEALSLALHELLTNALKHGALSNERGYIEISCKRLPNDSTQLHWREVDGPEVVLTGRVGYGSLLLTRVLEMHGHLEIAYPPEGVDCTIRLGERVEETPPPPAAAAPQRKIAPTRVLVVEDENIIAMDLFEMIETAGYEVVGPYRSVATTMKWLDSAIDLALLDINLEDGQSTSIAQNLKERGIPFAVLSGHPVKAGSYFDGVPRLSKPFRDDQVIEVLQNLQANRPV